MLSGAFYLQRMSTAVSDQHRRVDQRGKAPFPALERLDAVCSSYELLQSACPLYAALQIFGIESVWGAILVLFQTWNHPTVL